MVTIKSKKEIELNNIKDIAAGYYYNLALDNEGYVYSWGYNYYGQFGNKTTTSGNANPYPVKMQKVSNIIQITAGEHHISMLDADGSIWSTGCNSNGQFGTGTTQSENVLPTQMLDTDGSVLYGVREIASGRDHTVLIKEDNTVWSVGYNGYGQLGLGTTSQTTKIQQVKEQITTEDGTTQIQNISNAKHITAAGDTTYISRQKDEQGKPQGMYVIGDNNYGQLFTKDTNGKTYATPVETDKDILTMAVTTHKESSECYQTGAIVDQDGMVYTVGYNSYGEMGNGTTQHLTTPWCISKLKIETNTNIINYKNIGLLICFGSVH